MEYRKIANTDLELSVITFGAWAAGGWMWGGTEQSESVKAILEAYDKGVTSIDTAPVYGMGKSEEIVAEAIKDISRDKVQILTKYGLKWDTKKGEYFFSSKDNSGNDIDLHRYSSKESIIKECEDSLRRLKTDYIDLYQIHWADPTTPIQESMEAVTQLIKEGKVRYAGVCNYTAEQFKEAEKYVNVISNQVPYSMVNKGIDKDVVPYSIQTNKAILAYSPIERGLLSGKMKPGYKFSEGDHRASHPFFTDEFIAKTNLFLAKIKPIADDKGATLAQLVLRWTIDKPGITIALAGARNAKQSVQNAGAADIKLSKEEFDFIAKEVEKL